MIKKKDMKKLGKTDVPETKYKHTKVEMGIIVVLLSFWVFWMKHTYGLISMDKELQAANWDPFSTLGVSTPVVQSMAFNSPDVKKAYRKLAKKFHPDKIAKLPLDEQPSAKNRWLAIAKAYETLTNKEKFKNW